MTRRLGRLFGLVLLLATAPAFAQTPPPGGPGAPTPDSVPPCANAVPAPRPPAPPAAQPVSPAAPRPALPPATTPNPIRQGAVPKHECFKALARRGAIDVLFVGDSITDFFGRADRGQSVWNARYGALRAANFGISGDTTQDVLWRMQNGELEGFQAKVIVLMLGTNNIGRNDPADIAAGDAAIIAEFRKRQPQAKVLLLGVFPRGAANGAGRAAVKEINSHLARLHDGESVFFLDIGERFLNADGSLLDGVMVDGLHPSAKGYEVWADAIDPTLKRLLR